jgi:vacuole morphology and inheritance protein 14
LFFGFHEDLRLQLLEVSSHPYLFKSLYGLLMLLPQSAAFDTLRNRLNSISSLALLHLIPNKQAHPNEDDEATEKLLGINFESLLEHFCSIQQRHVQNRKLQKPQSNNSSVPNSSTKVDQLAK